MVRTLPLTLTLTLTLALTLTLTLTLTRCAPFWMSAIDSRVVRRSHQLFREAQPAATGAAATGEAATGEAGGRGYGVGFGFRERALARDEAVGGLRVCFLNEGYDTTHRRVA